MIPSFLIPSVLFPDSTRLDPNSARARRWFDTGLWRYRLGRSCPRTMQRKTTLQSPVEARRAAKTPMSLPFLGSRRASLSAAASAPAERQPAGQHFMCDTRLPGRSMQRGPMLQSKLWSAGLRNLNQGLAEQGSRQISELGLRTGRISPAIQAQSGQSTQQPKTGYRADQVLFTTVTGPAEGRRPAMPHLTPGCWAGPISTAWADTQLKLWPAGIRTETRGWLNRAGPRPDFKSGAGPSKAAQTTRHEFEGTENGGRTRQRTWNCHCMQWKTEYAGPAQRSRLIVGSLRTAED